MTNDHPILWGVILQSECVLHYIYGVKQTSCTLCRVLSDPPDRVGMRSAISQRARPRASGGSIKTVQTLEGGSPFATSSPLSVHTSTRHTKKHCFTPNLSKLLLGKKMFNFKNMCEKGMKSDFSW